MSAYMSFFIRGKDDTFYPIGSYSRNTALYQMFDEAGFGFWEQIGALSEGMINLVLQEADYNIRGWKREVDSLRGEYNMIPSFNNSVEDKQEAMEQYRNIIKDYEERINELEEVRSFCHFLKEIIGDVKYGCGDEMKLDAKNYIYTGIEIGHPTVEDIV